MLHMHTWTPREFMKIQIPGFINRRSAHQDFRINCPGNEDTDLDPRVVVSIIILVGTVYPKVQ